MDIKHQHKQVLDGWNLHCPAQEVGPDLDPNGDLKYFFLKKVNLKKICRPQKIMKNFPACNEFPAQEILSQNVNSCWLAHRNIQTDKTTWKCGIFIYFQRVYFEIFLRQVHEELSGKVVTVSCWYGLLELSACSSVSTLVLLTKLTQCILGNFASFFFRLLVFFKINFLKKCFQGYQQSVNQFRSKSSPTFCQVWSGSKLLAKISRRRHYKLKS